MHARLFVTGYSCLSVNVLQNKLNTTCATDKSVNECLIKILIASERLEYDFTGF